MISDKIAHTFTIGGRLTLAYPDACVELNYTNAFELMIASILAAQNTDKNVNLVTANLFRKYRTAEDYTNVSSEELEKDIYSTGFFKQKAKSIQAICRRLIDDHGGKMPKTMDELLKLPGVGRKTANVVLGNAFGLATGIVVATHVPRPAGSLGQQFLRQTCGRDYYCSRSCEIISAA